ncbi:MAG: DUF4336 domain-containing protein [Allorhizobium sp.]
MSHETYPPLNTPKSVADDVWIVDGPIIRFGAPWPKMPFPTRMTILRIDRDLMIHSPTPLTPELKVRIAALGTPRWIVGPNRIHYWWIPDWHHAFSDAQVYLASGVKEQAGDRIDFDCLSIDRDAGYPWDGAVATLRLIGSYMTEVVFFHRATRTLILTDAIENFEPRKIASFWMRWLTRLGGVQDPDGQMPRDMRVTFRKNRSQLKGAVETMINWDPERVLLAHGRWYDRNGVNELRRAFRWVLD